MMTIFPYEGVDDLKFTDDPETIKNKLTRYRNIKMGTAVELDKKYPSLTAGAIHIVFFPDTRTVRFFQISAPICHAGNELYKSSIESLTETYSQLDPNLQTEVDGFDSSTFGFAVNESENEGTNDVLVYSRQYGAEPKITPEDILKYYMPLR